jgi:hypothetical protein
MLDKRRSSALSPRRSTLAKLDNALLIAVAVVGAIIAFQVIGWLFGALWFVAKLLIAGLIVGAAASFAFRRVGRG